MDIKKYLTLFDSDSDYEDFYGDESKGYNFPNTSYTKGEKNTHYEPIVRATGLSIDESEFLIKKGETKQLTATIAPNTATVQQVVWKSSNRRVATVDQNGLVTAVALTGSCDIYAMTFDGSVLKAVSHCTLDYTPVTAITLNYYVANVEVDGTVQLIATVEPAEASQDVVWSSSDPSIVSVDSNGLVSAVAISGDAIVTATTVDQGLTASCAVHIDFHPVTGIELDKDYLEFLSDGESAQTLVATVLPTDATIQDVTWSSSDETIATVDENGVVTATALGENTGTCIITVTTIDGGYTAECEVKVKPDYDTRYFTLRQLTGGPALVHWSRTSSSLPYAYISLDSGSTWESMDNHQYGFDTTGAGQTILFKRVYTSPGSPESGENSGKIWSSTTGTTWAVEGNIMSLVYGDDFVGKEDFGDITDVGLFEALLTNVNGSDNSRNIVSVDDLRLPAKVLKERCYSTMFGNQVFRVPPKLPARTLAKGCYSAMFAGCENMTSLPELPATDIPDEAYESMFSRCSGIRKIPSFKNVTSFGTYSFRSTFGSCTNLTTLPEKLFTNSVQMSSSGCSSMFSGCTSLVTIPENFFSGVTSVSSNAMERMFAGCTSLTTPMKLPVKPSSVNVCRDMFSGCTSLTTLPEIPDGNFVLGSSSLSGMFMNCTSLTEIPEGYLSGATSVGTNALNGMFNGCTSLTTVPATLLPVKTQMSYGCYKDMFKGCTSLTSGPGLPTYNISTGNTTQCYGGMYSGCTNLNEITCMAVVGISTARTQNWAVNVAPTGTFYKHENATGWTVDSVHGIPPGWTAVDIKIEMNKPSTALAIGETEQLYAITTPEGRSQDVTWASSDETIATVDENGVVTAVGTGGTAIISATSVAYGITTTCKVGVNMEGTYFTIVANEASNINVYPTLRAKLSASTDGTSWTELPTGTTTSYSLSPNDKLMFKGGWSGGWTTSGICSFSGSTGNFEAEGNVMSLVSKDAFSGDTDMTNKRVANLFYMTSGLTNASMMVLPATTLETYCYNNMFYDCPNLKHAPKIPAATLKERCYQYMFYGCKSMIDAPTLPATTLAENCYYGMFMNCSGLTRTPELPATTLVKGCYGYMFSYCYSLTEAPELPATTLAEGCYEGMFISCRDFTEFPELPATTLAAKCYERMFERCSGITSIDINYLPVTNLETACYKGMFNGCNKLTNLPKLSATTLAEKCYQEMFSGCTALTSVPSDYLQSTQLGIASYAKMFSECTNITSVPELPATVMTTSAYTGMFDGCRSLTSIPTDYLPSTQLASCCYQDMFRGCTGLTSIQTDLLKATTLANDCYYGMFSNCSHITNTPDLVATTLAPSCYKSMFEGCSALTEFTSALSGDTIPANACQYMFQNCVNLETVPENMLPATTLSSYCYNAMFKYCYKLSTMMVLPAPDLVEGCYKEMFFIRDISGTIRGNLSGLVCLCMTTVPNTTASPIYGMLTYQKNDSSTLYKAEGTNTSWRNDMPGGWVPTEWSIEVYNP